MLLVAALLPLRHLLLFPFFKNAFDLHNPLRAAEPVAAAAAATIAAELVPQRQQEHQVPEVYACAPGGPDWQRFLLLLLLPFLVLLLPV